MSWTIWKYPLGFGQNILSLPLGSKVLTAQVQAGSIQLWAFHNPGAPMSDRIFRVLETGWEIKHGFRPVLE